MQGRKVELCLTWQCSWRCLLNELAKRFCSDWLAFSALCSEVLCCVFCFLFLQLAELLCCREPCFLISARLRLPGLYFKMALYLTPFSQVICASDLSFSGHVALHFVARALFVFKWAFRVVAQVFPSHWFPFWLTKKDGCEEQLREDAFILLISWLCRVFAVAWRIS